MDVHGFQTSLGPTLGFSDRQGNTVKWASLRRTRLWEVGPNLGKENWRNRSMVSCAVETMELYWGRRESTLRSLIGLAHLQLIQGHPVDEINPARPHILKS